tara:strand:+ start:1665 stop:2120 length:456 start_codon:yes stop_codon:yes gene_type:complete
MPWKADGSRKDPALYKKSGFKMGSSPRYDGSFNARTPNKPLSFKGRANKQGEINTVSLEGDALAEANMDGSISVDPSLDLSSAFGKKTIKHEKEHLKQIDSGRAAYDDNWVMWEGKLYIRQNGMIDGPNGKFPEGDNNHPWEQEAVDAETK